jgi:hypothetical protein
MAEISKQALLVDNNQSFPDNNSGTITPVDLRSFNVDLIDSTVNQAVYTSNSSSWNVQIGQLNAFTASQQPSFTALNSFTASQLVTNAALNGFTQSANQELDSLSAWTGSWEAWTSSINEIRDAGILQGYSTRFYFGGLVSASIVQNVNGPIASINIEQDGTKLNTSSFNDYTASTAATQSVFSASVATSISNLSSSLSAFTASQTIWNASATASIQELLNLSSSLSGGYATQGELDASSSALQANINTKLNTSSFNAYTSSNDAKVNSLISFTGSYATTGSNSFIGNQIITGNVTISGSATTDLTVVGQIFVSSSATGGTTAPKITISGSSGQTVIFRNSISTTNGTDTSGIFPSTVFSSDVATLDEMGFTIDPSVFGISGWSTGPAFYVNNTAGDTYPAVFGFQNKANYTDGRVAVLTPLSASAGIIDARISGSTIVTGSVCGNVVGLSIASQTASMDLTVGNFFTLTLVSGSTTHLTATNIRPGQTVNLLLTQPSVGTGSVTYNSTFDFPAGNEYIATAFTSSKDILTFITFDSSTIYATSINNLV